MNISAKYDLFYGLFFYLIKKNEKFYIDKFREKESYESSFLLSSLPQFINRKENLINFQLNLNNKININNHRKFYNNYYINFHNMSYKSSYEKKNIDLTYINQNKIFVSTQSKYLICYFFHKSCYLEKNFIFKLYCN